MDSASKLMSDMEETWLKKNDSVMSRSYLLL